MKIMIRPKFISLAVSALLTQSAVAGTAYVETYGASGACSKSAPCAVIQEAIDIAGNGGRVIVGPGTYPGELTINLDKLRLLSVAGAHATTIDGGAIEETIIASGSGITIGQRRKGFHITGQSNLATMEISGDRHKVEGNIIDGGTLGSVIGIKGWGKRTTVRYNQLLNVEQGVVLANQLDVDPGSEKWIVSDNHVVAGAECISFVSGPGNRNRITGNQLTCDPENDSSSNAIKIENAVTDEKTNEKIQDNVVSNADFSGIDITRGNPRIHRNLLGQGAWAVYLTETRGASVTNNLGFENYSAGVYAIDPGQLHTDDQLTVKGNTFITTPSAFSTVFTLGNVTLKNLSNNNIIGDRNCAISVFYSNPTQEPGSPMKLNRNFWGTFDVDSDGFPDLSSCPFPTTASFLEFNPSATARPMKYKSTD